MLKSKKTWLASMIGAFAVFALSVIAIPNVFKTKADTTTDISTASLEMELGSSLKYNDKGGLRYMVKMDETTKDLIVNNDEVKLYFVITSKAVFDQYTDKTGTNYADMKDGQCIKVLVAEEKIYAVENAYYANGVIGNVTAANRNADLVSIAYITDGTNVQYATVDGKAVGAGDFSIDPMKGNVYKVANALMYENTDDATKILTNENYSWFGTAEYPIVVDSSEKYDTLIDKINASDAFAGKSVKVNDGVTTEKEITNANKPIVSREFLIDNEEEFISFISDTEKYTENDIIKLTADLDFETYSYTGNLISRNGDEGHHFYGTFDGQNHSISNFNYKILSGKGGIFSNLGGRTAKISGHVKNLALLNCNIDATQYFVAGNIFYQSTIENVYVQGTTNSTYGIARLSDEGAKIINCLANITFGNNNGTAYGDGTTKNYSELVNCYAITDAKTAPDGTKGLTEPYASVYRFIQAKPTFGEGCPITFDGNGIYFNGKTVAAIQRAQYTVQHKWGDTVLATDAFEGVVGEKTTATSRSDLGYVCIDTVIDNQEILSDGSTVVVINYVDYPELLQFNAEASLNLVKSGSNVSLVDDTDSEGNAIKAIEGGSSGAQPVTINLGGKYTVSEIAGIQVKYKITKGNKGNIMGMYINGLWNDSNACRVASHTISATQTQSESAYTVKSITQAQLKTGVSNNATLLSNTDSLNSISFMLKDKNADFTIRIDSIKIIPFSETLLDFNSEESIALVTSGSNVSIVDDTDSEGNAIKAVQATAIRSTSATPFTINLGGKYTVSEIAGIQVTYRITSGLSGTLVGIYVNEQMSDYSADRVSTIKYSSTQTVYATQTITQKNLLTKLAKTDPVTALSIIEKDSNRSITILIDSIKIIPFSETLLDFNSEESIALVTSGSNVSIVDDTDSEGNTITAVQATAIRSTSATPFTINLGGKYTVSQIAEIKVTYKITSCLDGSYVGIYVNEQMSNYNTDRVSTIKYIKPSSTETPVYATQTITQSNLLTKLDETDPVTALSIIEKDSNRSITIRIDSIKIILK